MSVRTRVQAVGQVARGEVGAHRGHAAADVDADRGRRHRALHRDDAADGGARAEVDVGHRRDVVEDPGQRGDVAELVERRATRPRSAGPRGGCRRSCL